MTTFDETNKEWGGFCDIMHHFWQTPHFEIYTYHSYPHFDLDNIPYCVMVLDAEKEDWHQQVLSYLATNEGGILCYTSDYETILNFIQKWGYRQDLTLPNPIVPHLPNGWTSLRLKKEINFSI